MLKMLFSKKNWLVLLCFPLLSGCWLTSSTPNFQFIKEESDTILAWYENAQNQVCILTEQANYCTSHSDKEYKERLASKKKIFFETAVLYIHIPTDDDNEQYHRLDSRVYLDKRKYSARELKNDEPYWHDADSAIKWEEENIYAFYKEKEKKIRFLKGYYSEPHFGLLDYADTHKVPKQFATQKSFFYVRNVSVNEAERKSILAKHKLSTPAPVRVIHYKWIDRDTAFKMRGIK